MKSEVIRIENLRPHEEKIELIGNLENGEEVRFDPFVGEELKWYESTLCIGKAITIECFRHIGRGGVCYLPCSKEKIYLRSQLELKLSK